MPEITLAEIESTVAAALEAHGAAPGVAASVAHAVRVAEAKGNKICGLYYVESYCRQLVSGRVNGTVEPIATRLEAPSVVFRKLRRE